MLGIESRIDQIRDRFPALARAHNGRPLVYLDGPAGTQVPECVISAISEYQRNCNANHEGLFPTSRDSDAILARVHEGLSDFLHAGDPGCVYFGPNMTTLTMSLSRALSRTWQSGDEIIVTRLDHDANVSPWVLAAHDVGATIRFAGIHHDDCTLDLDQFHNMINSRTKLVAVGCASNATGTVNPVRQIADWTHSAGGLVFLDAVHYAPHRLVDVSELGGDFLACSAYKFFGPHIGVMWGRRDLLTDLEAYKVRPAANRLPDKWMTGTQNHACLAGTLAAVEYLADLGRELNDQTPSRREALATAYSAIRQYEQQLVQRLLAGLGAIGKIRVHGITDPQRIDERLPTVALTHKDLTSAQIAARLGEQGICVWHGNYYALELTETLGVEPEGMVRIGLTHYNTASEVDRLLTDLRELER